ncbi:T9SS type B sorting domain-containing protein [Flagellimonas zhangzhouensis]|uniref:Gliding motility-associated C-terminal domain-containing protein n=1 Tax=Flagellimonas zhangzhouensis TaxID=1073328 RepID=A0A1H2QI29_9FLAO|nr:T9SS type B sorting domain-containing protein [Allomuricauda zhangzhouensis]SDQ53418.1 gliding motility-associated C-terminal domain-containing protein [Allomuricauda zhangzhouensis]SDW06796.1 gliding motility-associated C-terminal domain-containing protein [Allomuricauda zhangzhouensis]
MFKNFARVFLLSLFCQAVNAQIAQDCVDAIPICSNTPVNGGTYDFGSDDFNGATATGCLEATTLGTIESNSAWYRFRTNASGQLGFNIGHDSTEDWDFALYQASDCNLLGDPIRCNFFDNSEGVSFIGVGEDPTGNTDSVHFEDWLEVEPGQDYYLFINNYSNVNSGFSIQFTGTIWETNPYDALDCSIVSNLLGPPIAACEGDNVELNATTADALNYSWFMNTGSGYSQITGATSATYTVTASGDYRVVVATNAETIISDVQVGFNPSPMTNQVSDETFCQTDSMTFDLNTKDVEALGNQSPNDFMVSYHSSPSDATMGIHPLEKEHTTLVGQETIYVRTTSMANSNCFDASQSFVLEVIESPVLTFSEQEVICETVGSLEIGEAYPVPNFEYMWNTGQQTPTIQITEAGEYTLTVSNIVNGVSCESSRTVTVSISEMPVITSIDIADMSVNNVVTIHTEGQGEFEFALNEGEYQSSNIFEGVPPGVHTVHMRDLYGCGEVVEEIVVVGFLTAFTPNGDVLNDLWQVEGLSTLNSPIVTIYDRYGKLIKQMSQFDAGWDGNFQGKPLPSTDYWFKLSYLDNDGNRIFAKYLQSHFSLRR